MFAYVCIICIPGWQMPWCHQVQLALQVTDLCQIAEITCGQLSKPCLCRLIPHWLLEHFIKLLHLTSSHHMKALSGSSIDIRADPKASSTQAYSRESCLVKESPRLYLRNPSLPASYFMLVPFISCVWTQCLALPTHFIQSEMKPPET